MGNNSPAQALMDWVQKEIVESYDDNEIMGDHRTIVDLYDYARSLEAHCESLAVALEDLPEKMRAGMEGYKGQAYRIAMQLCEPAIQKYRQSFPKTK